MGEKIEIPISKTEVEKLDERRLLLVRNFPRDISSIKITVTGEEG